MILYLQWTQLQVQLIDQVIIFSQITGWTEPHLPIFRINQFTIENVNDKKNEKHMSSYEVDAEEFSA